MAGVASASASAAPLPAALASSPAARAPPSFLPLRARCLRGPVVLATGRDRRFRAEAIRTQREKAEQETEVAAVEESFPVREAAGLLEGAAADDPLPPADEDDGWVVRFGQQFNIFLTDSIIMILDALYRDRDYARFFVLEMITRVLYFGPLVESCCRRTSCHAHPSNWSNKECFYQKVHCQGYC